MKQTFSKAKIVLYFVLYYGVYLLLYQDFLASFIIQNLGVTAYFVIDLFAYVVLAAGFIIIGWRFYRDEWEHLKENRRICFQHVCYSVFALFVTNIVLSQFISNFFPDAIADNQTNNDIYMSMNLIGYLLSACIFAPFIEETIFRACIFAKLRERFSFLPSACISGFLFGFLHIFASLITGNLNNCIYFIIYAMCGFVLCIPYEDTGNFFSSVLTHASYNLFGILVSLWLK